LQTPCLRTQTPPFQMPAGGMLSVFTSWAQLNIPDPSQAQQAITAYQQVAGGTVPSAVSMWLAAGGNSGLKAYNQTIKDLTSQLTAATPGFTVSMNSVTTSSDTTHTWANGHVSGLFDFFEGGGGASWDDLTVKLFQAEVQIDATINHALTFPCGPLARPSTEQGLSTYNPWYNSEALNIAAALVAEVQAVQHAHHVRPQVLGRGVLPGQQVEQGPLEQPVEDRVRGPGRQGHGDPGEFGVAADDAPDHLLATLVDLQHVGAERFGEQALIAQVVPEPVHRRVGSQGLRHRRAELALEFGRRTGAGDDLVVAGDARGLVLAHAVRDQVFFVAEVVVQHAVRELGVLRDLAQAGAGVAEFGERLQRGVGQLGAPFGEFVDLPT
jgi:hypothetical protein